MHPIAPLAPCVQTSTPNVSAAPTPLATGAPVPDDSKPEDRKPEESERTSGQACESLASHPSRQPATSARRSRPGSFAIRCAPPLMLSLLAACNTPLADEVARRAARSAVNPVLARQFPGVPLEPATNCVIDNASAGEIVTLASTARQGVTDASTRIVLDIVRRPDTLDCLATDGLPVLLQTLQEA